jgi:hypothetical protein
MSKVKRVLGLAGILVLALAMLFGCARLFLDTTERSRWYIRLNIGGAGTKAIGVEEYDVTRVEVALFAPGESLPFYTLTWHAGDAPVSELIPVSERGKYRIEVTHVGDDNGEPVEAKESMSFNIAAMVITVITVTPGAVGLIEVQPGEQVDLTGYWDAYLTPTGGNTAPPHLLYIKQTDSLLNGFGVTGSVEDSAMTMSTDDGEATFSGTIESDGTISGTFDWTGETGIFEMERSDLSFGPFELSGLVSLSEDHGMGFKIETEIEYRLDSHIKAGPLEGSLSFISLTGLAAGSYSVIPREGAPDISKTWSSLTAPCREASTYPSRSKATSKSRKMCLL